LNRLARHELAERVFVTRHVRGASGERWVRACTTGPFDVAIYRPDGGRLQVTFVEIKTARGRRSSDLSSAEADFGKWAEANGSPFVVARYRVVGTRVVSEHIYRPFVAPTSGVPETEIVLEVVP
jgi:hypothetical protein